MKKRFITLTKINLVLAVLLLIAVLVAIFFPITPLTVKSVKPDQSTYNTGDEFTYTVDRCKNISSDIVTSSERYLIDVKHPNIVPIDLGNSQGSHTPRGCGDVRVNLILPDHIPTGTYRLKVVTTFTIGWWRKPIINTHYSDTTFIINNNQ